MYKGLATHFGNALVTKQDNPLTDDQLMQVAPSIFAQGKHDSRSDRYTYIPTIEVLNGLRKEGFQPFMAVQSRSRIEGKQEFTKHMLRLRHENQINGDEANEIILINSHDGTSSYQMLAGVFRFVCQNGMICGDTVEDIRVPHRGNIVDNVIDAAYTIIDGFDAASESMETMKSTTLALPEAEAFAIAALSLKYDDVDKAPVAAARLLDARRYNDRNGEDKNTLWGSFNRVQENLIRGGQRGYSATGKRVSTRPVQAIDTNVKLNKALWILADSMAKMKQGNFELQ